MTQRVPGNEKNIPDITSDVPTGYNKKAGTCRLLLYFFCFKIIGQSNIPTDEKLRLYKYSLFILLLLLLILKMSLKYLSHP